MKKIVSILAITILLTACNNDDTLSESTNFLTEDITNKTTESGRLNFESEEEFREFIQYHLEVKTDLLEEARTVYNEEGRLSLLLIYNSLEEKEAEKLRLTKKNIPIVNSSDSMLLFLLNEKGEMRIKNTIFRIDDEFVYSYKIGYSSEINKFKEAYNTDKIKVTVGKPISFGKGLTVYMHTNNQELEKGIQAKAFKREFDLFNGRKARMISKQWNENWFFYSSIGSLTKVQEWSQFLWWHSWKDAKTDNRLKYNVSYRIDGAFNVQTLSGGANGHEYCNCYEAKKVYKSSGGVFADEYTPADGWTQHWAHWYPATPNTVSRTIFY